MPQPLYPQVNKNTLNLRSIALTLALDRGERSASRLDRFTPGIRAPSTHWIGKGKVVPVGNLAPRHEDVLGNGGIAQRIHFGTRWRWSA
jgi:hypothetical protein